MRASIATYLSLLAVLLVTVTATLIAKEVRKTSMDIQVTTSTQLSIDQNNPQLPTLLEAERPCMTPMVYTSLPAKCRTADGTLMELNGQPSAIPLFPELK